MANVKDKIPGGVFAINKPTGISSAQVLRDMQHHFNPSNYFAAYMRQERQLRSEESYDERRRRSRAKRVIQVKIGHGGTLDPLATGVLITGIGAGTKELMKFLECTKSYETVVLFGAATDTYDRVGKIIGRKPYGQITKEKVEQALSKFRGKIMQRPPIYSALRLNGKRLYEYAREGKELPREIEERPVEVLDMQLIEWMEDGQHNHKWPLEEAEKEDKRVAEQVLHFEDNNTISKQDHNTTVTSVGLKRKVDEGDPNEELEAKKRKITSNEFTGQPTAAESVPSEPIETGNEGSSHLAEPTPKPPAVKLRMTVTSGFYVRSLCHDLGEAVGSLAIMSELVRTRQGDFELGKNVLEYEDLAKGEEVWSPQVDTMLDAWNDAPSNPE